MTLTSLGHMTLSDDHSTRNIVCYIRYGQFELIFKRFILLKPERFWDYDLAHLGQRDRRRRSRDHCARDHYKKFSKVDRPAR